jgi:hypothetical protein
VGRPFADERGGLDSDDLTGADYGATTVWIGLRCRELRLIIILMKMVYNDPLMTF